MRPHMHNQPCTTLLWWFGTICTQGQQRTTKRWHFATICNVSYLQYSTVLPFNSITFSNLFWHFWTICDIFRFHPFQYSTWLCHFFWCVTSDPFHMITAPYFWLFRYYFRPIGLALCWCFTFHSIITAVLVFLVATTTKYNRKFPLWPSYSVLTSDLVAPLVILILACVSCISHWSLSPF